MNELVQPGKYHSKVVEYGQATTSTGKEYVFLMFDVDGKRIKWTGYLTDNALQKTMESLITAGCKDLGAIADGSASNAFDPNVMVSITVEHEQSTQDPTKTFCRVRWINPLTKQKDASTIAASKSILAKYQGQFEAAKMKMGVQAPKASAGF